MIEDVTRDQLVVIRIEGMHCHRCEQNIQKSLGKLAGVHEVEVDFASGQASVLFNDSLVSIPQLLETVKAAGYRALGFTQKATT